MAHSEHGAERREEHRSLAQSSPTAMACPLQVLFPLSSLCSGTQLGTPSAETEARNRAQTQTYCPFARIPIEIIADIFLHVHRIHNDEHNFEPHPETHLVSTLANFNVSTRNKSFFPTSWTPPLVFLTVCRHWHSIALSTPRLWTDLVLDDRRINRTMRNAQRETKALRTWLERSAGMSLSLTVRRQVQYQEREYKWNVDLPNGGMRDFHIVPLDPRLFDERQCLGPEFEQFLLRSKHISIEGNRTVLGRVLHALKSKSGSDSSCQASPGPAYRLESLLLKVVPPTGKDARNPISLDISSLLPRLKRLRSLCVELYTDELGTNEEVTVETPAPELSVNFDSSTCPGTRHANGNKDQDDSHGYPEPELRELKFDSVYWMCKEMFVQWLECFPGLECVEIGLDVDTGDSSLMTGLREQAKLHDASVLEMKRLKRMTLNVRIDDDTHWGMMAGLNMTVDQQISQILVHFPALVELTIAILPRYAPEDHDYWQYQAETQAPILWPLYHRFFQVQSSTRLKKITVRNVDLVSSYDVHRFISSLAPMDCSVITRDGMSKTLVMMSKECAT